MIDSLTKQHRRNLSWLIDRTQGEWGLSFAATLPLWWKPETIEEAGYQVCSAPVGDLRYYLFATNEEAEGLCADYKEAKRFDVSEWFK